MSAQKATHTPGLWSSSGEGLIADCPEFLGFANARPLPVKRRMANARLIAAAPELYEALTRFCDAQESDSPLRPAALVNACNRSRELLAKVAL